MAYPTLADLYCGLFSGSVLGVLLILGFVVRERVRSAPRRRRFLRNSFGWR